MSELVTRYIVAVDNDHKQRKERGFERRYVRDVTPQNVCRSLTIDCEKALPFTDRTTAKQVSDTVPSGFVLEWLLPE